MRPAGRRTDEVKKGLMQSGDGHFWLLAAEEIDLGIVTGGNEKILNNFVYAIFAAQAIPEKLGDGTNRRVNYGTDFVQDLAECMARSCMRGSIADSASPESILCCKLGYLVSSGLVVRRAPSKRRKHPAWSSCLLKMAAPKFMTSRSPASSDFSKVLSSPLVGGG